MKPKSDNARIKIVLRELRGFFNDIEVCFKDDEITVTW